MNSGRKGLRPSKRVSLWELEGSNPFEPRP